MTKVSRADQVWLLLGFVRTKRGVLKCSKGRLSFTSDEGQEFFDAEISELRNVKYPFLYFGGGVTFTISGVKYRVSFIQPGNTAMGEYASISDARELGKAWKPILESGAR